MILRRKMGADKFLVDLLNLYQCARYWDPSYFTSQIGMCGRNHTCILLWAMQKHMIPLQSYEWLLLSPPFLIGLYFPSMMWLVLTSPSNLVIGYYHPLSTYSGTRPIYCLPTHLHNPPIVYLLRYTTHPLSTYSGT